MEKQEILEKSQQENKEMDIADREAQRKGSWIGFVVALAACLVITILQASIKGTVPYPVFFVLGSLESGLFFAKYAFLRKKHELLVAVSFVLMSLGCLALSICQMIGAI
jgi:hypothetical protein